MKRLTKEWVKKAELDYRAAAELHRLSRPVHDVVCFHGQQSAEKYLKALLQELGLPVLRTHDLAQLHALLLPRCPTLRPLRRGLLFLSRHAVDVRYPGFDTSRRQAGAA